MPPRIRLINCDEKLLRLISEGDAALAAYLQVQIPENWMETGREAFLYILEKIKARPEETRWWSYLPIWTEINALVGSCGFKGPPDENGMVEIGYEVAPSYRNRGLATQIAKALVKRALEDERVRAVQAHTPAEENASTRVLVKSGFRKVETLKLGSDGKVWKWIFKRTIPASFAEDP